VLNDVQFDLKPLEHKQFIKDSPCVNFQILLVIISKIYTILEIRHTKNFWDHSLEKSTNALALYIKEIDVFFLALYDEKQYKGFCS
jgi:hypothetical protein